MIGTNFGIYRPTSGSGNATPSASTTSPTAPSISTTPSIPSTPSGQSTSTITMPTNISSQDHTPNQQISDFILQLEDYVPTVPDSVTSYFLNSAGFESNDPRIVRLISIATQKFISDVANDALQHCKTRTNCHQLAKGIKQNKDRKYTLTMDDLSPALADYGITVRKAQYFP